MFRAAMPDSNSVKTTAQLTDGSASWASPNSFTARQLWEWMPVDTFVQTFGTTNSLPNLAELTSSGVRLRELDLTPFLLLSCADFVCSWCSPLSLQRIAALTTGLPRYRHSSILQLLLLLLLQVLDGEEQS